MFMGWRRVELIKQMIHFYEKGTRFFMSFSVSIDLSDWSIV